MLSSILNNDLNTESYCPSMPVAWIFLKKKFGGHPSTFYGATDTCFELLVMFGLGFKGRMASWQRPWQPRHFNPHTCEDALVGLKSRIYRATAWDRTDALPTELCSSAGSLKICWPRETLLTQFSDFTSTTIVEYIMIIIKLILSNSKYV